MNRPSDDQPIIVFDADAKTGVVSPLPFGANHRSGQFSGWERRSGHWSNASACGEQIEDVGFR